jgi:hypothetical protein
MATDSHPRPSFSPYRKWGIGLHVILLVVVVLSVVVMVNYLSRDYFLRFHLSAHTKIELFPRTVSLLRSITNQVKVTLYYDTDEELYQTVTTLLSEYRLVNPKITVATVDYMRDPGAAAKVKAQYNNLFAPTDKNLIIFDCEGKRKVVQGNALAQYVLEQVPNEKEREFRRKPTAFLGESAFTMALLDVTSPKPLKACYLQGHGEHQIDSGDDQAGYLKFGSVLYQNNIQVELLSLLGTNSVPADCNLLVIAGPRETISDLELGKIEQYLNQGGRLLALFNCYPILRPGNKDTGLEGILAKWGVDVGHNVVKDKLNTISETGTDVIVVNFSKHAIVNSLVGSALDLIMPRSVGQLKGRSQAADAPRVDELAASGPSASAAGDLVRKPPFPLAVAVEKGAIKDVITERGATRMVIAGDSLFLANHQIDSAANRDFAGNAVNWLLERTHLLAGLGPRPVEEHSLVMTKTQLHEAQWVLLGGLPAAVLFLGGLVWLRRRK